MNFSAFGGLALAVLAGLWLMVFVPSWFKRSQERELGHLKPLAKAIRSRKVSQISRLVTTDNFNELAESMASPIEPQAVVDERAWQRTELPAPMAFNGSLEQVEFASVASFEEAQVKTQAPKLEQSELDEILRRRRANG